MKITKRVKAGCALVLAGALVFPGMSKLRTEAAQAVDVDKQDCSITISISVGEFPVLPIHDVLCLSGYKSVSTVMRIKPGRRGTSPRSFIFVYSSYVS